MKFSQPKPVHFCSFQPNAIIFVDTPFGLLSAVFSHWSRPEVFAAIGLHILYCRPETKPASGVAPDGTS